MRNSEKSHSLTLNRLHTLSDDIVDLFRQAFPQRERRCNVEFARVLRENPDYHLVEISDNGERIAYAGLWLLDEICYLEHLVVKPDLRNRGYGALILDALRSRYPKMILEVDPPEGEIERRRISFYCRENFILHDTFDYVHPGYAADADYHKLILMSSVPMGSEELRAFCSKVKITLPRALR